MDLPIQNDRVVTLAFTLRDDDGALLETSESEDGVPFAYLHGHENLVPGLEAALAGRRAGDTFQVVVEPADGYGEASPDAVVELPRAMFEDDIAPGDELSFETEDGEEVPIWVIDLDDAHVRVDLDHPFAGLRLHYDVQVLAVRDAAELELEQGYPAD